MWGKVDSRRQRNKFLSTSLSTTRGGRHALPRNAHSGPQQVAEMIIFSGFDGRRSAFDHQK